MKPTQGIHIFCILYLCGCSAKEALRTQDNPNCQTVVEGFLHSKISFNGKVPALILPWTPQQSKVIYGEIVSTNDSGIVFDPEREGPFLDLGLKFYPYSSIKCALDKDGNAVYGALTEKQTNVWNLEAEIVSKDRPAEKPLRLALKPNEPFSYCLAPGIYSISEIEFNSNQSYVDRSISLPPMNIIVKENAANYIGDLFLDFATKMEDSLVLIKAKAVDRPGYGVMGNFGLVGGMMEAFNQEGLQGHTLKVTVDSSFSSRTKLPINVSPLNIEHASQ